MSLKQRLGSLVRASGRLPVIAGVVYHPAIRGAVQTWPGFRALYGRGWDLLHPFDRMYGTDTSGFVPSDELPNSPFATTKIQVYAASQPSIVRSVLKILPPLETFTFIDLGCGKGRPLFVASEFPFRDIVGVELSPPLADIARANAAIFHQRHPSRRAVRVEVGDASTYVFPPGDLVIFLFNPFGEEVIRRVIGGIEAALAAEKRRVCVVYYNPVFGACFDQSAALTRFFAATIPYADDEVGYGFTRADPVVVWQGGGATPPNAGADARIEISTPGWSCELRNAAAVLTFAIAMLVAGCGRKEEAAPPAPPSPPPAPPVVQAVKAVEEAKEARSFQAIARLDGSTNTEVRAQVSGYLVKQAYQEGAVVKAGDLLFLVNTKPLHPAPPGPADANPAWTKIVSPVGGVAGRAIPGVGDLIGPDMTLTTISTVDPIRAAFALPKKTGLDDPGQIAQAGFDLLFADGTPYPHKGTFDHIERAAQAPTGVITVYAFFPNPDRVLQLGQYAKVRVTAPPGQAPSVPLTPANH